MPTSHTSISGRAFQDVLMELHQHVFDGVPDESDPFTLSKLVREYVAYVLACYYQCDHCVTHHERAIEHERTLAHEKPWKWQSDMVRALLFLRIEKKWVSPLEYKQWNKSWDKFAIRLHARHPGLPCYIAFAIGIARDDGDIMDLAFNSISSIYPDDNQLVGVIRDIDRVVVFMKAATSKNRTDPKLVKLLATRGITGV